MIAFVILECEAMYLRERGNQNRRERLKMSPRRQEREDAQSLDVKSFKDDWCRFVLYKLTSGCGMSATLHENAVTFVTFNYDMSLDHRLFDGLRALDRFDKNDIARFLNEERILHVYGRVRTGPLSERIDPLTLLDPLSVGPVQKYHGKPELRQADMKVLLDTVYEASKGLRTIDPIEKTLDEHVLAAARKAIEEAVCIYILGYGFDPLNSERLGMATSLRLDKQSTHKSVLLTNFGDSNRINKVASRLFFGDSTRLLGVTSLGDPLESNFYCEKSTRDVYEALALDFDAIENQLTAGSSI
jgi:hypothetical protein